MASDSGANAPNTTAADTATTPEENLEFGLPIADKLALFSSRYKTLDNRRINLKLQVEYPDPTNPAEVTEAQKEQYASLQSTLSSLRADIEQLQNASN